MSYPVRLNRVIESLRRRGVAGSVDRALSVVQERLFDLRYGTDTVSQVELDALTIESDNLADGYRYEATRLRPFRRLISLLDPSPESALVDFGSGKGRVLMLAAPYAFKRITGVEFAPELCATARRNVARYLKKTGINSDIRIIEGDAADYRVLDDDNFFYMFNPFSAAVVKKIAENIAESLAKKDRRVVIVYNNPLGREALERPGFLPLLDFEQKEFIVYGNAPLR